MGKEFGDGVCPSEKHFLDVASPLYKWLESPKEKVSPIESYITK